jgi:hypothetical protein
MAIHINLAPRPLFTNLLQVLNIMEDKTFTYIMAFQSCSEQIYVTAYNNQSHVYILKPVTYPEIYEAPQYIDSVTEGFKVQVKY